MKTNTLLKVQTATEWLKEGANAPSPVSLWNNCWLEGEVSCLFAESNLGKSILAVQIANELAATRRVLYCDFELSNIQFTQRYTDPATGQPFKFNPGFYRAEFDFSKLTDEKMTEAQMEQTLIDSIEGAALDCLTPVIIIDNLTYMCNGSEAGDMATRLMRRLCDIKKYYGFSLLVVGHTPKRDLSQPITQNDLAGSKRLFNFFDSVFVLGKSTKGENERYIKQLKTRGVAKEYGADSVLSATVVKDGSTGYLHLELGQTGSEYGHLKAPQSQQRAELREQAKEMREQGFTEIKIAEELGVSQATVSRLLNA